jgi:hypothetical protein
MVKLERQNKSRNQAKEAERISQHKTCLYEDLFFSAYPFVIRQACLYFLFQLLGFTLPVVDLLVIVFLGLLP